MKRINLIPEEAKKVTPAKWLKVHLVKSRTAQLVTLATASLIFINIWQITAIARYRFTAVQDRATIKKMQEKFAQIRTAFAKIKSEKDDVDRQTKLIEGKLKILDSIQGERVPWAKFLAGMSEVTPDDLWINKVDLSKDVVTVTGTTVNNEIVSRFMADLDSSKHFKNTSFNYTQKTKPSEGALVDFEVTTHIAL